MNHRFLPWLLHVLYFAIGFVFGWCLYGWVH